MSKFTEKLKSARAIAFQCIALPTCAVISKIKFKIKVKRNDIKLPKEPAIYLCNHQTNWDPVWHRALIHKRVFFIGHDELFNSKFRAWCFENLFDCVKRGANKNDVGAIKQLFALKKQNRSIGIFPEGGIPFWNETNYIEDNIAKLCKKLDMPIVIHRLYGASFYFPRYYHPNKARIRPVIERMRVISREELKDMSVEELSKIINEDLYVNDYAIQKERKIITKRKKSAEHLDKGLFCCPHCHEFNTIVTEDDTIKCTKCGFYNVVDEYGLFTSPNEEYKHFEDPIEWNHFQTNYLIDYLKAYNEIDKPILTRYDAYVKCCDTTVNYMDVEEQQGSIEVYKDNILLTIGLDSYTINYKDILKCYVEFGSTLEIKTSTIKVRVVDDTVIWSPYQFAKTINILKAMKLGTDTTLLEKLN